MQRLEVSGAVRLIYGSLDVKRLIISHANSAHTNTPKYYLYTYIVCLVQLWKKKAIKQMSRKAVSGLFERYLHFRHCEPVGMLDKQLNCSASQRQRMLEQSNDIIFKRIWCNVRFCCLKTKTKLYDTKFPVVFIRVWNLISHTKRST